MKTHLIGKILKWTAISLAIIFGVLQFIRPVRSNPPVDETRTIEARTQITPEVTAILARSCNDCHSNRTRWPWYTNISPVSWYVVDHINEGRRELNFSDWAQYSRRQQQGLLGLICREVQSGAMPLTSYLRLHADAKLSSADVKALCEWTNAESQR